MSLDKLHEIMETNDIYFEYHNQKCGVETEVRDYVPTYDLWYGDIATKKYNDFDEMVHDKIFDGRSLSEILGEIQIRYS